MKRHIISAQELADLIKKYSEVKHIPVVYMRFFDNGSGVLIGYGNLRYSDRLFSFETIDELVVYLTETINNAR